MTPSTMNSTMPQAPSSGHMTAVAPPPGPGGAGAPPTASQQPSATTGGGYAPQGGGQQQQQYSTGPPTSGVTPGSTGATDPPSQSTGTMGGYGATTGTGGTYGGAPGSKGQPKRLHVSNIPFRFREPDLRHLFYVSCDLFKCVCMCLCGYVLSDQAI